MNTQCPKVLTRVLLHMHVTPNPVGDAHYYAIHANGVTMLAGICFRGTEHISRLRVCVLCESLGSAIKVSINANFRFILYPHLQILRNKTAVPPYLFRGTCLQVEPEDKAKLDSASTQRRATRVSCVSCPTQYDLHTQYVWSPNFNL